MVKNTHKIFVTEIDEVQNPEENIKNMTTEYDVEETTMMINNTKTSMSKETKKFLEEYVKRCYEMGVIPCGHFERAFESPEIMLQHFYHHFLLPPPPLPPRQQYDFLVLQFDRRRFHHLVSLLSSYHPILQ